MDVITIVVPTLCSIVLDVEEQQQQGHPQKDCVGLLLALLRIVHLYGPKYLNATDPGTELNGKHFREIPNLITLLVNDWTSSHGDIVHRIGFAESNLPRETSVVQALIDVPEHYLMFLVERKKDNTTLKFTLI